MILRLKRTPGIYIVGFMASGKTTLGRMLANRIGWHFSDLDDEIESNSGQAIADIFRERGEAEFRRIEHDLMRRRIRSIECGYPTVLALGGGAFVQPDNYALVENNGVSLWLDCPWDSIERRVEFNAHRPLARDPDQLQALYHERRASYALADFRVDARSENPEENLAAILELPVFH